MVRVTGLNHFNIVAADPVAMKMVVAFYEKLGLTHGPRPNFGNTGEWMYIDNRPMIHINIEAEVGPIVHGTGTVHHLGLDVRGSLEDVTMWLEDLGIDFRLWPGEVPGWYRALYFKGLCGEEIELVLRDCYVPHFQYCECEMCLDNRKPLGAAGYRDETIAGTLTILDVAHGAQSG